MARAGQLQDYLENLSLKLSAILKDYSDILENLTDLELSVDIASDDKDTSELMKLEKLFLNLLVNVNF